VGLSSSNKAVDILTQKILELTKNFSNSGGLVITRAHSLYLEKLNIQNFALEKAQKERETELAAMTKEDREEYEAEQVELRARVLEERRVRVERTIQRINAAQAVYEGQLRERGLDPEALVIEIANSQLQSQVSIDRMLADEQDEISAENDRRFLRSDGSVDNTRIATDHLLRSVYNGVWLLVEATRD
jgi:hypothetical protein